MEVILNFTLAPNSSIIGCQNINQLCECSVNKGGAWASDSYLWGPKKIKSRTQSYSNMLLTSTLHGYKYNLRIPKRPLSRGWWKPFDEKDSLFWATWASFQDLTQNVRESNLMPMSQVYNPNTFESMNRNSKIMAGKRDSSRESTCLWSSQMRLMCRCCFFDLG